MIEFAEVKEARRAFSLSLATGSAKVDGLGGEIGEITILGIGEKLGCVS